MSSDLTSLLERAAGAPPPAPDTDELLGRGRRRRVATRATGVVAGTAVVAALALGASAVLPVGGLRVDVASEPPTVAPSTSPAATEGAAAAAVVVAGDGQVPELAPDAPTVAADAVAVPGLTGPFALVAAGPGSQVALFEAGADGGLRRGAPGEEALALERPADAALCRTMAYDTASTLWVLCSDARPPADTGWTLLAYAPGVGTPAVHDVDDHLAAVDGGPADAVVLAADGADVAAVVATGDPLAATAARVALVRDGAVLAATDVAGTVVELPPVAPDATGRVVGGAPGLLVTTTPATPSDPSTIRVDWLGTAAAAAWNHPRGLFPTQEQVVVDSSRATGRVALTVEAADGDQVAAYGVVADPDGTTAVLRLPTTAAPVPDPAAPPAPPAAIVALAPDGSAHLVAVDEDGAVTVAPVLDPGLQPVRSD